MRLKGRVALVTGASSGIGRAIANIFAAQGCDLAINGRNQQRLQVVSEEIKNMGRKVLILNGDVSDFTKVQQLGQKALSTYGKVDILVNNAGMSQKKTILELSETEWDLIVSVNLKSAFNWIKAILPTMQANGYGKIINISSVLAKAGIGRGSKAAYAASKAGLLGLTRGLAKEVAPAIYVNAVCPGTIDTPMSKKITKSKLLSKKLIASIPLQRFGLPQDVANVVLFLATEDSDYLTGEIIDVNGGSYMD